MHQIHALTLLPGIFISDMSPMNITPYIHQCHITNGYIVKFVGTNEYLGLRSSEIH
jgi:hypothetical protein